MSRDFLSSRVRALACSIGRLEINGADAANELHQIAAELEKYENSVNAKARLVRCVETIILSAPKFAALYELLKNMKDG